MNVLTLGTFDLFHEGHVRLLKRCREIAGEGTVTVLLNRSEFVEGYKGTAPIVDEGGRYRVLEACRHVDRVFFNPQLKPGDPALLDDGNCIVVVGSDWRDRDYIAQLGMTQEQLDDRHILIVFVPYGPGSGSTGIKSRVLELAR